MALLAGPHYSQIGSMVARRFGIINIVPVRCAISTAETNNVESALRVALI